MAINAADVFGTVGIIGTARTVIPAEYEAASVRQSSKRQIAGAEITKSKSVRLVVLHNPQRVIVAFRQIRLQIPLDVVGLAQPVQQIDDPQRVVAPVGVLGQRSQVVGFCQPCSATRNQPSP